MLPDMATEAAFAPAILLAVSCCCALRPLLLQLSETQNIAQHACRENIFKQLQLLLPCEVSAAAAV